MKQTRLLLSALFLTLAPSITAQTPTALWGKSVQTAKITGGSDIQMAADDGLYVIGNASTRTEEEFVTLGSNNIAPGSLYRGTNENSSVQMIFLTKLSADGQPQWTVYSKDADVMSNSMFLQPTSDGVVAFLALRHVEKGSTHSPYFVDAASNKFSLDWAQESDDAKRYYIGVVMKLNNDGAIQWVRQIQAEHAVSTTGINPYALAKDDEGYLYLAGQQRTELSLSKSDLSEVKIAPHNIPDGWNGTDSAGDLFVIKLDSDGYYLNHLQTEGSSKFVSLLDMKFANGKLYAVGYVVPSADNHSISLGGKTMALSANNNTMPFSACLNTDMTAQWAQAYESNATGFTMQQPTIHVNQNHIWWAGMGATSLTTKTGKSLVIGENMNRVATLLKIDAANGDLLDGYLKPLFQTGYFALLEDTEGYIYASGYAGVLTSKTNPNERKTTGSMYMDKFNSADLTTPVSFWENMIQYVGGPTGVAYTKEGRLYTLTRSQSTENPLMGGSVNTGQTTTNFSANICAFQLPVTIKTDVEVQNNVEEINGIFYIVNSEKKTLELTKNPNQYSGDLEIPSSVQLYGDNYNVTSIGYSAFAGCVGLTSITIPSSVTSIGGSAFDGCTGLTSVIMSNGIKTIGGSAFAGCVCLTSITIPSSVTTIGSLAFANCSNIIDVYSLPLLPPSSNADLFEGIDITKATLYIEESSFIQYIVTKPWLGFGKFMSLSGKEMKIEDIVDLNNGVNQSIKCEMVWNGNSTTSTTPWGNNYARGIDLTVTNNSPLEIEITRIVAYNDNNYSLGDLPDVNNVKILPNNNYKFSFSLTSNTAMPNTLPWANIYYNVLEREYVKDSRESGESDVKDNLLVEPQDIKTIYSLSGSQIKTLRKGLNIVKMANGKTKKILVK